MFLPILSLVALAICSHASRTQEFDTPLNLYINDGIFRGMCERSNISLDDIQKATMKRETFYTT